MLELIKQRLMSKTYWTAIVAAIISILEINGGFIGQYIPMPERQYIIMLWPILMLTLREITTTALSDK